MITCFRGRARPSQFIIIASAALALSAVGCSSDNKTGSGATDAGTGGAGGTTGGAGGTTGGAGGTTGGAGGTTGGAGGTTGGTAGTGGTAAGGTSNDGGDGCVAEDLTVPTVPDALKVPGTPTLIHHYHAVGIQTYTCVATDEPPVDGGPDGGAVSYAWGGPTAKSTPTATLSDDCGEAMVHHSAVAGVPRWTSLADGSFVAGAKVAAVPQSGTIPWLLLSGTPSNEPDGAVGLLSTVTYVQRLDTKDGAAPATGCDGGHVNDTVDVNYTADYYFYTGS